MQYPYLHQPKPQFSFYHPINYSDSAHSHILASYIPGMNENINRRMSHEKPVSVEKK